MRVFGLFQEGQQAFTDFMVLDPAQPSYLGTDLEQVYHGREQEKNCFYEERIRTVEHGHFFPSVISTYCGFGPQLNKSLCILAERLSEKHKIAESHMKALLRTRIQFSVIRGVNRCLRGTRKRKTLNLQIAQFEPFLRGVESADVIVTEAGLKKN